MPLLTASGGKWKAISSTRWLPGICRCTCRLRAFWTDAGSLPAAAGAAALLVLLVNIDLLPGQPAQQAQPEQKGVGVPRPAARQLEPIAPAHGRTDLGGKGSGEAGRAHHLHVTFVEILAEFPVRVGE